jgi:hypothetical protein
MTRREQIKTVAVSTAAIMRTKDFAKGVEDVRAGRAARFDDYEFEQGDDDRRNKTNALWAYERGRLFVTMAPRTMALRIGGKLNPEAVNFCRAAAWFI